MAEKTFSPPSHPSLQQHADLLRSFSGLTCTERNNTATPSTTSQNNLIDSSYPYVPKEYRRPHSSCVQDQGIGSSLSRGAPFLGVNSSYDQERGFSTTKNTLIDGGKSFREYNYLGGLSNLGYNLDTAYCNTTNMYDFGTPSTSSYIGNLSRTMGNSLFNPCLPMNNYTTQQCGGRTFVTDQEAAIRGSNGFSRVVGSSSVPNYGQNYCNGNSSSIVPQPQVHTKNGSHVDGDFDNPIVLDLFEDDPSLLDGMDNNGIFVLSSNQVGSQYLQRILTGGDLACVNKILNALEGRMVAVMTDPFGNYVFQKLLKSCSINDQILELVLSIISSPDLISAAINQYGSLSIQKLLKTLKRLDSPLIGDVMVALQPGLLILMTNMSGRHLIGHCLKHLTYDQNEMIYTVANQVCLALATDRQGYLVLCSIIETIRDPLRRELLTTITNNAVHLSYEPIGNYVLQKVLQFQNPEYTRIICDQLKDNLVLLSMHKHSSHVVEKCLKSAEMEFVASEFLETNKVVQLAKDQYGNYVIQKVLEATKSKSPHLYTSLVQALMPHLKQLQNHPNGRNVFNMLNKDLPLTTL
ncbi:hypothetical protein IFM89_021828 [Coptis chinensis]|uniref:PUM-HD domain-containing protein n=1 Tax=Coptis chinensis TaxID=261450 RepID=A0A835LZ13_9MAGN|nr:hypothetical protein IFM89_021828 [Coptis chinensis]